MLPGLRWREKPISLRKDGSSTEKHGWAIYLTQLTSEFLHGTETLGDQRDDRKLLSPCFLLPLKQDIHFLLHFVYLVWERALSSVFSIGGYWRLNSGLEARQPSYQMDTPGPRQQANITHHLSSQAWPVHEFTLWAVTNDCQCLFNDQFWGREKEKPAWEASAHETCHSHDISHDITNDSVAGGKLPAETVNLELARDTALPFWHPWL